ncbi:receptor-like protein kinase 5 [Cryptomeria japonica]|uniref:receptor-like protein kinase 5 n=1 Tax=Cryptomeria japonica TaxID=3369 RepID=UPI0027DA7551|nr:receptor-like protein kinase 5 [Cryptomeria japonica]
MNFSDILCNEGFSFGQSYTSKMPGPSLAFFGCILSYSLLLLHCTSLSQDGQILLQIKKVDWRDRHNTKALSDCNESHQNPGSFPHGLFRCKRFRKLNLSENQFAGRLPRGSFLHGLFHCKRLQKLDFSSNGFAGKLPSRICELSDLRELKLANNVFSGSIPPAFGMLPKLKALFLNKNKLNGKFNVLQNLKSLAIFWIDSNPLLPGAVPRWIGDSRQPWQLGLENCKLVVGIPYFFGNLTQLQRLYLSHNRLWGNIPTSLMELSSLKQLALNYNNVSGEIPDNIHQLRSLTTLDLSHNGLSGRIPSELQWPSLVFDISYNNLSGLIPDVLDTDAYKDFLLPNPRLCESKVIGSGGAEKVYKVIMQNGQAIAIRKIWNRGKATGNFKRNGEHEENKIGEVEVDILGLICHTNIFKLLCFISSEESDFKLLVYEFMPNDSLFDSLHGNAGIEMPLQWSMCYKIALGAAPIGRANDWAHRPSGFQLEGFLPERVSAGNVPTRFLPARAV